MKKKWWIALLLLPVGVAFLRAGTGRPASREVQAAEAVAFDEQAAAGRLAAALRLETVAGGDLDPFSACTRCFHGAFHASIAT